MTDPMCHHSLRLAACALLASTVACSDAEPTRPTAPDGSRTAPEVAAMSLSPGYRTTDIDGSIILDAGLLDAGGRAVSGAPVEWTSVDPALATVDQKGNVQPRQAGVARVAARSGRAADTAVVAVLGKKDLLVTVLPGGELRAWRAPGRAVSVPVTIDLMKVGASGDLGSIQLDLTYDPSVLDFVAARPAAKGLAAANLVKPGLVRFAFAATESQGRQRFRLLTLQLRVRKNARPGRVAALGVSFAGRPTSTGLAAYAQPMVVAGRIVVGKR
jgi:hypothetical protein